MKMIILIIFICLITHLRFGNSIKVKVNEDPLSSEFIRFNNEEQFCSYEQQRYFKSLGDDFEFTGLHHFMVYEDLKDNILRHSNYSLEISAPTAVYKNDQGKYQESGSSIYCNISYNDFDLNKLQRNEEKIWCKFGKYHIRTKFIGWNMKKFDIFKFKHKFIQGDITTPEQLLFKTREACDAAMPRVLIRQSNITKTKKKVERIECVQKCDNNIFATTSSKTSLKGNNSPCKALCLEDIQNDWRWGYSNEFRKSSKNLNAKDTKEILHALFPYHDSFKRNVTAVAVEDVPQITDEELLNASYHIKTRKHSGLDRIPPKIVKLAVEMRLKSIKQVLNEILITGEIPVMWKTSRVILKRKRLDKLDNDPKAYRPLCVLSWYAKLLERIILFRVTSILPSHGGLSDSQYAYRKGFSKLYGIKKILSLADKTKAKGICALVTLDVRNAFNVVSWELILREIKQRNFPIYLYNIINNYLQERYIISKDNTGKKEVFNVSSGVPQGSVLAPTLWNIFYDGVLTQNLGTGVSVIAFADDLALVVHAQDSFNLTAKVNTALTRISSWLKQKRLQLAPEKTKSIILSGKKDDSVIFNIDGVRIQPIDELKYLGYWFHYNTS